MGNEVKEYRFASQTFNANGDDATVHTTTPINGNILAVEWSFDRTGSVYITMSGTGQEVFRRNTPSGTGWQCSFPRKLEESTTGSVIDARLDKFPVNEPLILNVNNAASGTITLDVVVKYI